MGRKCTGDSVRMEFQRWMKKNKSLFVLFECSFPVCYTVR